MVTLVKEASVTYGTSLYRTVAAHQYFKVPWTGIAAQGIFDTCQSKVYLENDDPAPELT